MVRSGRCRPREVAHPRLERLGELLVGDDALLAKLAELFDLLVGFPARGPLDRCCRCLRQHLLVQFLVVILVAGTITTRSSLIPTAGLCRAGRELARAPVPVGEDRLRACPGGEMIIT